MLVFLFVKINEAKKYFAKLVIKQNENSPNHQITSAVII